MMCHWVPLCHEHGFFATDWRILLHTTCSHGPSLLWGGHDFPTTFHFPTRSTFRDIVRGCVLLAIYSWSWSGRFTEVFAEQLPSYCSCFAGAEDPYHVCISLKVLFKPQQIWDLKQHGNFCVQIRWRCACFASLSRKSTCWLSMNTSSLWDLSSSCFWGDLTTSGVSTMHAHLRKKHENEHKILLESSKPAKILSLSVEYSTCKSTTTSWFQMARVY